MWPTRYDVFLPNQAWQTNIRVNDIAEHIGTFSFVKSKAALTSPALQAAPFSPRWRRKNPIIRYAACAASAPTADLSIASVCYTDGSLKVATFFINVNSVKCFSDYQHTRLLILARCIRNNSRLLGSFSMIRS